MKYINNWIKFNESTIDMALVLKDITDIDRLKKFLYNYGFNLNIDFDNLKIINGNSNNGLIYEYQENIYKLTFDTGAYLLAFRLKGKKFYNLANIIDVQIFPNKIREKIYLIKMEKCYDVNGPVHEVVGLLSQDIENYFKNQGSFNNNDFPDEEDKKGLLGMLLRSLWEEEEIHSSDYKFLDSIDFIGQIANMKKELISSGLSNEKLDIHQLNVMQNSEGDICLIDFIYPKYKKSSN